ncbi:hypothetical protein EMCRGX_G024846 [Ephydatia muelleri]
MMFVYECPSLQDGERELKEDAARDDEVEGAIVLLDQGTNVDGTDEWRGEVEDGLPGWTSAERGQLGQELSDVLNNLIRLAKRCHVDHPSAVLDKMVLNGQKYPVSRAHGSSLKYTSFVEEAAAQSKEP